MKARLAKKLAHTPWDRLAPYWINKYVYAERSDARLEKAIAKWRKRVLMKNNALTKNIENNENNQIQG